MIYLQLKLMKMDSLLGNDLEDGEIIKNNIVLFLLVSFKLLNNI